MTTRVTIKNDSLAGHDISVRKVEVNLSAVEVDDRIVLGPGTEESIYIWGTQCLIIEEVKNADGA